VLASTYAFNMGTLRERVEGNVVPLLLNVMGMRRFAKLVIARGLQRVAEERAEWIMGLIAEQDRALMVEAWKQAMAFDSRPRLAEIKSPTLIVAGSKGDAVPLHHAEMLHQGIIGSRLVLIDGADHALLWTHPDALVRVTEDFLRA